MRNISRVLFSIVALLSIDSISFAQMTKVEALQRIKARPDLTITEIEPNVYKVENKITHDAFIEDANESVIEIGTNTLKVISAGTYSGNYASIQYNQVEILPYTFFWGIVTTLVDTITLQPHLIRYFEYPSHAGGAELKNYIDSLPLGSVIILTIAADGAEILGSASSNPVRESIKSLGSAFVDSIRFRDSWAIIGKKGAQTGSVPEAYQDRFQGIAVIDTSKVVVVDSLTIEVSSIDTSLYSSMYLFWKSLDISNSINGLLIFDFNSNGLPELYGNRTAYNTPLPPAAYELDNTGNLFQQIFVYPDTVAMPKLSYDIDNDNLRELLFRRWDVPWGAIFYKQHAVSSIPTNTYFEYIPPRNNQVVDEVFGDLDMDGKVEYVFSAFGKTMYIAEFNPAITNFDSVYSFISNMDVGRITVGDFDLDQKPEIIISNMYGDVHVIESQGNNQYLNVWNGKVSIRNAYYTFKTNDIDKNGKPEFWVGGKHISSGILLTCFEADGNDNYSAKFKIKIPDYYTFNPLTTFSDDLDGDEEEEIIISADYFMLVLKFSGSPNNSNYSIWYFKMNQAEDGETWTVVAHDINHDSKKELFFDAYTQKDSIGQTYWKNVNRIFKPNFSVDVENEDNIIPIEYKLYPIYPNPFNASAVIKFTLPFTTTTNIKIYNVLGEEIKTLLDKEMLSGAYTLIWDGTDNYGNNVSSGVYLIKMQTINFSKTIKAVLLK